MLVYEKLVAGNQDLYLVPAGGGLERRLTTDPAQDGLPRFTPDGRHVIYTSNRSGGWQLWEVDVAGGEPRRVRSNAATEWQAALSPDAGTLAFLSNLDGAERLWLMAFPAGAARVLVRHGEKTIFGNPHWSPDGKSIVFSSNHQLGHQIYVVEAATGAERRISAFRKGGCEPRFSPDGKKVVYVSRGHLSDKSRLVEHDLASDGERVLVDWPALNYDPVYAPDGTELAFASNITGEYQVYRQRIADRKAWRMTSGPGSARYPDYVPSPAKRERLP